MGLVILDEFFGALDALKGERVLFCDTETTGLRPYHGDRLFSIIIGGMDGVEYFNFKDYDEGTGEERLGKTELELLRDEIFGDPTKTFVFHNAKFDLHMLRASGIEVKGKIYCTMVAHRLLHTTAEPSSFSLAALGKGVGFAKDKAVEDYIKAHKLYQESVDEMSGETVKLPRYDWVPLSLIVPYGIRDVEVTRKVYFSQKDRIAELSRCVPEGFPPFSELIDEEMRLIKTVLAIEARGVKADVSFCFAAIEEAKARELEAKARFQEMTGREYLDSTKLFAEVLADVKDKWVYGPPSEKLGKVSPIFDKEALPKLESPVADIILEIRKAEKDAVFYQGFLKAVDADGVIHTNLNQHVPKTGRFSSSQPNLQNAKKDKDEGLLKPFVVRRALIPRMGMVYHMLDFQAMEYRLMLEYAARFARGRKQGVMHLVEQVKAGKDLHQVTADLAGTTRTVAKSANFAILYGAGDQTLSILIKSSLEAAKKVRAAIYAAAPELEELIWEVRNSIKRRGYLVNLAGRVLLFPDVADAYKGVNYLIQGGCADIMKRAMNQIEDFLVPYETKLILQIHDELIFEGPPGEAETVMPVVQKIMEEAYSYLYLPMKVEIEHSFKSLADKEEGVCGKEA